MTVSLDIDGSLPNDVREFLIEGRTYYTHQVWNTRMGWVISLYDQDPTKPDIVGGVVEPIIAGLKAMPNGGLTWLYQTISDGRLFSGDIIVWDTEAGDINTKILKDDLGQGKRFQLVYFTQEELELFRLTEFTTYNRIG